MSSVHPVYTSATSFAKQLPSLVRQAQHGKGQIGHLVQRLHLESYVKKNVPRLETLISGLGRPALAVGKTVVSGFVALFTVGVLTFFILLEAPRMIRGVLNWMHPERSARVYKILGNVGQAVAGYMLGNLATSLIAGIVVFVTLRLTGVPVRGSARDLGGRRGLPPSWWAGFWPACRLWPSPCCIRAGGDSDPCGVPGLINSWRTISSILW